MDFFFLLTLSSAKSLQKYCQYSIFRQAPVFWNTLVFYLFSSFVSECFIFSLYMCLIWPFCTSVCCVSISRHFIILLCHRRLPLRPLLHKHITSPPLFLSPLSLSVFSSLPSSVCLSLCSRSEGPQTHLCALICCAIVPLTPCCQPLEPLSHWHTFIIILSSPSLPITHTPTDNHPLYQRDSEKILNSNPISVEADSCV